MNTADLIRSVCNRLEHIFRDYTLLNKNEVLQAVRIFPQYIPQPEGITFTEKVTGLKNYAASDYEANFPCVIVKHLECVDSEERRLEMCVHSMRLIFGVYDENPLCQGWKDILSMIERVKLDFFTHRYLDKKFRLCMPVKSRLLDSDTWPIYFGEIDLLFEGGRAAMPADFVHRRKDEMKYAG